MDAAQQRRSAAYKTEQRRLPLPARLSVTSIPLSSPKMPDRISYSWKLFPKSFSLRLPFRGTRISVGFWVRRAKDAVTPQHPGNIANNNLEVLYQPLPIRHIRTLTLHPGSGDEPLYGTLDAVSLDSSPEFDAFSYLWGISPTGSHVNSIIVNGRSVPIGAYLAEVLFTFRHKKNPTVFRVDAICINQQDDQEKLCNESCQFCRHGPPYLS
ncbi:hypothetical protein BX600DRAFT_285827 [Xylariales sp. PMI_506]|nr:hypothetical protein BX600DRAFT_285827 [Xylariales sp. PMI_506]